MRITLHVAAVASVDGIWFVAAERSAESLSRRLSELVRARAAHTLWPDDALEVERALAGEQLEIAISRYFATVGQRWDREILLRTSVRVTVARARGAAASTPSFDGGIAAARSGLGHELSQPLLRA